VILNQLPKNQKVYWMECANQQEPTLLGHSLHTSCITCHIANRKYYHSDTNTRHRMLNSANL
jgi:hypothetical protein